jgi:long-chain acyl-CoA synthetase
MSRIWVFDVDGCLFDSLTGTSWRPQASELLDHLHSQRCTVILWSAGGADYARRRAEAMGVDHLFHDFHDKDGRDHHGRYVTHRFLESLDNVIFVDDRPEDMPRDAEVVAVRPYLAGNPHDRGLDVVLQRAGYDL